MGPRLGSVSVPRPESGVLPDGAVLHGFWWRSGVRDIRCRLAGRSSASDEATVRNTEIRVRNRLAQESKDQQATCAGPLSQVHSCD